jgi:hypothetical protein
VGLAMKTKDEIDTDEINGNNKTKYNIAKEGVYLYVP